MKKLYAVLVVVLITAFVLTACGGNGGTTTKDLLGTILGRGTLVISTDPAYPPLSVLKADPVRSEGTKCAADQKTLGELEGFDIDTAAAIANSLGVEPCFVSPDWGLIVSGNWAGRWDISVGSVTIKSDRVKVLYFAQPYYTVPAAAFVHADNTTFTKPADLSGKIIGVCGGCTYESFLDGSLVLPGEPINFIITGANIKTYDTDTTALEDLALGDGLRLDAVITNQPTGLDAIANGRPLKQLGDPVFYEFNAPAIDRSSTQDPKTFLAKVTEIVRSLHADGSLLKLSMKWFGADYTTSAAAYNLSQLDK